MRPLRLICLICLILLAFTVPTAAQTNLALGQSATAQLTVTAPQATFVFTPEPGQPIQIDLFAVTDGLAPQAVVLDPSGGLALAIGNPEQANQVRGTLTAVTPGTYTLQVSNVDSGTGAVVVSLTAGPTSGRCEVFVEETLRAANETCALTGRNEACVGNTDVRGVGPGGTALQFNQIGDIVPVTDLESVALSPLDTDTGGMGTVLMRLQANLPGTLPGQNVVMLLFGGTQLVNRTVSDPTIGAQYSPMQAFYFTPGIGPADCNAVPASGVMVQTTQVDVEVAFNINGIDILLGSTALFTFQGTSALGVQLLDGTASVTANGRTQPLLGGQQLSVPVGENFLAAGSPSLPQPIPTGAPTLPVDVFGGVAPGLTTPAPGLPSTATPATGRLPLPTTGACVVRSTQPDVNPNVRSGPGPEFGIISFLEASTSYPVVGRNAERTWYQVQGRGWVAAFVVETGGDCTALPVTYIPPTATPTPTPTPTATPIPDLVPCDAISRSINIDSGSLGALNPIRQSISHIGDCAGSFALGYTVIRPGQFDGERDLRYSITCTGSGAPYTSVSFSDGSVRDCSPTPYNVRVLGFNTPQDQFTFQFSSVPPGDVQTDITVQFSVLD
jgi:hypothetical protein